MAFDHVVDVTAATAIDVSSDQRVVAVAASNNLTLLRPWANFRGVDEEPVHTCSVPRGPISLRPVLKLRFNPTLALAHLFATSSSAGALAVWSLEDVDSSSKGHWEPAHILQAHNQAVSSMSWHFGNPQQLLSGSNDGKIRLWDLRVRSKSQLSISHRNLAVRDVQFRKDSGGNHFAAALNNGTVEVWDVRHPDIPEVTFQAYNAAYSVDWNPCMNNILASGIRDGYLKIWDLNQSPTDENGASTSLGNSPQSPPSSLSSISKRSTRRPIHRPLQSIETMEKPVAKVLWRPQHPYQIVTSGAKGNQLQLWNTLEPHVPLATINACDAGDSAAGFEWVDLDLSLQHVLGSSLCGTSWWRSSFDDDDEFDADFDAVEVSSISMETASVQDGSSSFQASEINQHGRNSPTTESVSSEITHTLRTSAILRAANGSGAIESEKVQRLRDQQRQRFRKYKHQHKSAGDAQKSWSALLSCSKSGKLRLRLVTQAVRPIEVFRPSGLSFSVQSELAVSSETVPPMRLNDAFLLNKPLPEGTVFPKPRAHFALLRSLTEVRSTGSVADAVLGFDAEQFVTMAKAYVVQETLAGEIDGTEGNHHSENPIARCCSINAQVADDCRSPTVAQLWRLIKLLFCPRSADQQLTETKGWNDFDLEENLRHSDIPSVEDDFAGIGDEEGAKFNHESVPLLVGQLPRSLSIASTASRTSFPPTQQSEGGDLIQETSEAKIQSDASDHSNVCLEVESKEIDTAIQFPLPNPSQSLWLSSSLTMLCKLRTDGQLPDKDFVLSPKLMKQDAEELADALIAARPIVEEEPVPPGQQKLQKKRRRQRRKQFMEYYSSLYKAQLEQYGGSDIEMHQLLLRPLLSPRKLHEADETLTLERSSSANMSYVSYSSAQSLDERRKRGRRLNGSGLGTLSFQMLPRENKEFRSRLVHDILEYHANIGDVQTCVMILLVLRDSLQPKVDDKKKQLWFCSYIDLLQRLQVYAVAARIISASKDSEVEKWYRTTSMIAEGCSNCLKVNSRNIVPADVDFKGMCNTCKSLVSRCAICEQLVRGVYVWCQGCGHAGHLEHMNEWFKTETECPTGCGHKCDLIQFQEHLVKSRSELSSSTQQPL